MGWLEPIAQERKCRPKRAEWAAVDLLARVGGRSDVAHCVDKVGDVVGREEVLGEEGGLKRGSVDDVELNGGVHHRRIGLPVVMPILDSDGHR